MPPMWWKMIAIMMLLFALFATIVCINSEISKRRSEAAAAVAVESNSSSMDMTSFVSHHLLNMASKDQPEEPQRENKELPAEDIDERVRSIFKVHDGHGVILFNSTAMNDDASLMPISTAESWPSTTTSTHTPTQIQTQNQSETQSQSTSQAKPKHYHQYQSLNHQQQSFKVQRSPDGKLNLVFNEPIVSLQTTVQQQPTQQEQPAQQPQQPRRPISDVIVFPDSIDKYRPTRPTPVETGDLCMDGFNQSRSFCTKVNNYPDLSGLKGILSRRFANFFSDEPQPTDFGLRMNDDEMYLCNSHQRYLYPKYGQKLDLTWQYIVNTDEFKQGILIEECDHEGEGCQFLDSFPNNYVPVCKQHYVIRHLATINNASNGQPEVANEPFKIPSCCKCVIKNKYSVESKP
ncbi:PREDICTED: protein spaetzle isoform X2 [Drosophila arizonae]|uniref:Protein spaetzle isoform X2 n=1 Tax=Drosophila arizonae TaxID=7263 RepID=A0ABM1NMZ3_DROAR|nr:PREDICTED: protein spaetzle isoform X2 [Drosophila arizonae]